MKKELLELLESLENYVPKLINASSDMAENIQSGKEGEAFIILQDYIDGMMWFTEAVGAIKSVNNLYLEKINLQEWNLKLADMQQALENQDYVLLADILEYEIKKILQDYLIYITELKMEVQNE